MPFAGFRGERHLFSKESFFQKKLAVDYQSSTVHAFSQIDF